MTPPSNTSPPDTSADEPSADEPATVAVVRLGCARNDVDSEELAARLESDGFRLVDEPADASAVLVNTCGFVEAAKKDSVDTLLEAAELKDQGSTRAVVAVGCMAERYGHELAAELPEADAVLGFDDYTDIGQRVRDVLGGRTPTPPTPRDRRRLLPISPVDRPDAGVATPGHADSAPPGPEASGSEAGGSEPDLPAGITPVSGPRAHRRRLDGRPVAPVKLASGCDRRCSFCAIPRFRGAFLSRPASEILAEARWLAEQGVRELFLVSENSTSYGKDLGDLRLLEQLLPELAATDGIERVRVSYLQPAEMRPGLVEVLTDTPGVAPYFDLSFQHASGPVLRGMRRFGDADRFLDLVRQIRTAAPRAGIRSNFIVGFPGETEDDFAELCRFVEAARLDVVGVFGYSDEDGTEAADYAGKLDEQTIAERVEHLTDMAEQLTAQRAEDRVGETVDVLVETVEDGVVHGRAAHQGPDVDGVTELVADQPDDVADQPDDVADQPDDVVGAADGSVVTDGTELPDVRPGSMVRARVVAVAGVDLRAAVYAAAPEYVL